MTHGSVGTDFRRWFEGSKVVDLNGGPLVVYRGEHGRSNQSAGFHSRLGSLTFGDRQTAAHYAQHPNHVGDTPIQPRIYAAYVAVKNPFLNEPHDPFVELSMIEAALGYRAATRIAVKFEHWVMRTSPWTAGEIQSPSVRSFLASKPDGLARLYFQAFPYFDDVEEVARLKEAGFDGAICGGAGANAGEMEVRVFDASSIWMLDPNRPQSEIRHSTASPRPPIHLLNNRSSEHAARSG